MPSFAELIKAKLAADGLSVNAAAAKVGLSAPGLRAAVKGKSIPNARSVGKYAELLGISVDEVKAMTAGGEGAEAKKGRRGRKPGRKAAAKPGRKPGRKAGRKGGRKAAASGDAAGAIAWIQAVEGLASDELAVAVHNLGKVQRSMIETIVANLG
jgi:transcriptional regulator with XRE-family HTH domain